MKLTRLFKDFFESEKAGGLLLVFVTVISLSLANSEWQINYLNFWQQEIANHQLIEWINDGLMAIFFLLIGLELEREIYHGELADFKNASLPLFGAVGGMLVPMFIFFLFNIGTSNYAGMGIPMATDIAFAIGILSLLGNRVPSSLKIFLTALAVIDDLGAVIFIAIFYTSKISFINLFLSLGIFCFLLIINRLKVHNLIPYLLGGVLMWYSMLHSGVHATISGLLLAFAIPFGNGNEKSPSFILQNFLHKPVAFFILPLFALANTCIIIETNWYQQIFTSINWGIIVGLIVGKPLGIFIFSFIGVSIGICALPNDLKWKNIIGAGLLSGIGFTMSIFITLLAFDNTTVINNAKIAILISSFISGTFGLLYLSFTLKNKIKNEDY